MDCIFDTFNRISEIEKETDRIVKTQSTKPKARRRLRRNDRGCLSKPAVEDRKNDFFLITGKRHSGNIVNILTKRIQVEDNTYYYKEEVTVQTKDEKFLATINSLSKDSLAFKKKNGRKIRIPVRSIRNGEVLL